MVKEGKTHFGDWRRQPELRWWSKFLPMSVNIIYTIHDTVPEVL